MFFKLSSSCYARFIGKWKRRMVGKTGTRCAMFLLIFHGFVRARWRCFTPPCRFEAPNGTKKIYLRILGEEAMQWQADGVHRLRPVFWVGLKNAVGELTSD